MIYHFVVGEIAAESLSKAIEQESSMQGLLVVLKDGLHHGVIAKEEAQTFSELRKNYWNAYSPNEKQPIVLDDMESLLSISAEMYKNEEVIAWFWMAPAAADICAYYWMLPYLSKHRGRFYVINIAGLPFLDESGKLYYPKSIGQILPKELVKARKLARQVTPSETEVDVDEWKRLVAENAPIRLLEGGKKIVSKPVDHFDETFLSFCSFQFQKASKISKQLMTKVVFPFDETWVLWNWRRLIQEGKVLYQGDANKALNEFEIKLPGGIETEANSVESIEQ